MQQNNSYVIFRSLTVCHMLLLICMNGLKCEQLVMPNRFTILFNQFYRITMYTFCFSLVFCMFQSSHRLKHMVNMLHSFDKGFYVHCQLENQRSFTDCNWSILSTRLYLQYTAIFKHKSYNNIFQPKLKPQFPLIFHARHFKNGNKKLVKISNTQTANHDKNTLMNISKKIISLHIPLATHPSASDSATG